MIYDRKELVRIRVVIFLITASAWGLLIAGPNSIGLNHCATTDSAASSLSGALKLLWAMASPVGILPGWAVMLGAMMLPSLTSPIHHIFRSSFAHRRLRAIALFLIGYGAIWFVAGIVIVEIGRFLQLIAPLSRSQYVSLTGAVFVAVAWQFSPIKQKSLNRCHVHVELAAFGIAADRAALQFGLAHGAWCACSCWALMLCTMLLPGGHSAAMLAATVLVFGERLEGPRPVSWRARGIGKMTRMLMAQMRIHGQALSARWNRN